jgi:Sel1 repeat
MRKLTLLIVLIMIAPHHAAAQSDADLCAAYQKEKPSPERDKNMAIVCPKAQKKPAVPVNTARPVAVQKPASQPTKPNYLPRETLCEILWREAQNPKMATIKYNGFTAFCRDDPKIGLAKSRLTELLRPFQIKAKAEIDGTIAAATLPAFLVDGSDSALLSPQNKMRTKECIAGDLASCVNLGNSYSGAQGAPENDAKAIALHQWSCKRGEPVGCANWGLILDDDKHRSEEMARGVILYERGCSLDDPFSCHLLGLRYDLGLGVLRDYPRAIELYQKACDMEKFKSCRYLGDLLKRKVVPGAFDRERYDRLMTKACNGGDTEACSKGAK